MKHHAFRYTYEEMEEIIAEPAKAWWVVLCGAGVDLSDESYIHFAPVFQAMTNKCPECENHPDLAMLLLRSV
jgi:hypothetical protein